MGKGYKQKAIPFKVDRKKEILKVERKPYVYIIRHKQSNKYYIGCKYSKSNCNKILFFNTNYENSYFTSSVKIKNMITLTGPKVFEIIDIIEHKKAFDLEQYLLHNLQDYKSILYNRNFPKKKQPFHPEFSQILEKFRYHIEPTIL